MKSGLKDSLTLLVIDDDAEFLSAIIEDLSSQGITVIGAAGLEEAELTVATIIPDCILLDYFLPRENSLDALDPRTHACFAGIPIVMLSSLQDEKLQLQCLQLGAQDFISKKSLDCASLVQAVRFAVERKRHHRQLQYVETHESLTGLANRSLFQAQLSKELKTGERVAVIHANLDQFSRVNDTYGPLTGDQVLRMIAGRWQHVLQDAGVVARVAGDEFAAIVSGLNDAEVDSLARQLLTETAEPLPIDDEEVFLTVSIGLASTDCADCAEGLMQRAEMATRRAKRNGRNNARWFSESMQPQAFGSQSLTDHLHAALRQDQLSLVAQPQLATSTGDVRGIELLTRWHHPKLGAVPPSQFIPVAENSGLIRGMTRWLVNQIVLNGRHIRAILGDGTVSFNLSGMLIRDRAYVRELVAQLKRSQIPMDQIEVEITETSVLGCTRSSEVLSEIRAHGLRVAIDDFGVGYSSFREWQALPFDTLKIDGSYVQSIEDSARDRAIVRAILEVGRALDIDVVAEKVETAAQYEFLRSQGCGIVQGYLTGAAEPIESLIEDGFTIARLPRQLALAS